MSLSKLIRDNKVSLPSLPIYATDADIVADVVERLASNSGGGGVNMVDVYGADPSGNEPVEVAIETALADGHRALYFPIGVYRITRKLILPRSVAILGAGMEATKFVADASLADFMFECRYDPGETGLHAVYNMAQFADVWLHMAHSGILAWGHGTILRRVRFSGGDPAGICLRLADSNEVYIETVRAGVEGGDFTLYANGIEWMAHDWSLADLQAQDAAGQWPGSHIGDGIIGTRDINYGDGVIIDVRMRVRATVPNQFGLRIAHESTKMPSQGDTSPNGVAGNMNNITVANCQIGALDASPEAASFVAYRFRRVQRCTFILLNGEGSGVPFLIENDGGTNVVGAEVTRQNVMIGCQGFNVLTTPGIKFESPHAEPPVVIGGTYMQWSGLATAYDSVAGYDSANATYNMSPRDTLLAGQVWFEAMHTGAPSFVIRGAPAGIEEVASGTLAGNGVATDVVIDLPFRVDGVDGGLIQVADNPGYWPRLVEGTDYTWSLEKNIQRYDRIRVTLTNPPASGTTIYARLIRNKGGGHPQIVAMYQDSGRSDGWNGYWSTHPKNLHPTHAIEFIVGEANASYICKPTGSHARPDARLSIGNGAFFNAGCGAGGPLARIEFRDPIGLVPWVSVPERHHVGLVFQPADRDAFHGTYQYWLGGDIWYQKRNVAKDGAPDAWDWMPLGWSHLDRAVRFGTNRTIDRTDLGRVLVYRAAANATVTVPGDLLREDEVGANLADANGNHMRAMGWLEIWNMATGVYTVSIVAGAGVTLVGDTSPIPQNERRRLLIERTGAGTCTVYVVR